MLVLKRWHLDGVSRAQLERLPWSRRHRHLPSHPTPKPRRVATLLASKCACWSDKSNDSARSTRSFEIPCRPLTLSVLFMLFVRVCVCDDRALAFARAEQDTVLRGIATDLRRMRQPYDESVPMSGDMSSVGSVESELAHLMVFLKQQVARNQELQAILSSTSTDTDVCEIARARSELQAKNQELQAERDRYRDQYGQEHTRANMLRLQVEALTEVCFSVVCFPPPLAPRHVVCFYISIATRGTASGKNRR